MQRFACSVVVVGDSRPAEPVQSGGAVSLPFILWAIATPVLGVLSLISGGKGEAWPLTVISFLAWLLVGGAMLVSHRKQRLGGSIAAFIAAVLITWTVLASVARVADCAMEPCTVPFIGFGRYMREGDYVGVSEAFEFAWWWSDAAFIVAMVTAVIATTAAVMLACAALRPGGGLPVPRPWSNRRHGAIRERVMVVGAVALVMLSAGYAVALADQVHAENTRREVEAEAEAEARRDRCTQAPAPGVDWHECDLTGAALSDVNLQGANLHGSNLFGASMRRANLSYVTLSAARLYDADLTGADLTGANLAAATGLTFADLSDAVWSNTTCPDGTNSDSNGGTCIGHL